MTGSAAFALAFLLAGTAVAEAASPPELAIIVTLCSVQHAEDCVRDVVPVASLTECNSAGPSLQAYLARHYAESGLRVTRIACQAGARA